MENKIITSTDTNFFSFNYEDVNSHSLNKNELLIKELITCLKQEEAFIPLNTREQLNNYKVLEANINRILNKLEIDNINKVLDIINTFETRQNENENEISKLKKQQQINEDEFQSQTKTMSNQITQLEKQLEEQKNKTSEFESKYNQQKNRKIIKLLDKIFRK